MIRACLDEWGCPKYVACVLVPFSCARALLVLDSKLYSFGKAASIAGPSSLDLALEGSVHVLADLARLCPLEPLAFQNS